MELQIEKVKTSFTRHRSIYLILLLLVGLNLNIIIDLVKDWMIDDNYSHGFFIIPMAIYFFYKKRAELIFPARPSKSGLWLFSFGILGLILGVAASEYFTTRFGLLFMITGLALYYLGYENFRKVWFSFFILWFMIPIPAVIYYSATLPLQLMATKASLSLLNFIGIEAARNGNIIILPDSYRLEVAEACSGLRSLVTLLTLGAIYGYQTLPGKILPITLFILTIPIALMANIFRIFITAYFAHTFSHEMAEGFLHEISGLLVFFIAMIIMIITGSLLKWIKNRFTS